MAAARECGGHAFRSTPTQPRPTNGSNRSMGTHGSLWLKELDGGASPASNFSGEVRLGPGSSSCAYPRRSSSAAAAASCCSCYCPAPARVLHAARIRAAPAPRSSPRQPLALLLLQRCRCSCSAHAPLHRELLAPPPRALLAPPPRALRAPSHAPVNTAPPPLAPPTRVRARRTHAPCRSSPSAHLRLLRHGPAPLELRRRPAPPA